MVKSTKARKQRKALYNAPAHVRRKNMASHLSESLRKEYGRRSANVIKGDTVMIIRGDGDLIGTEGKVAEVNTRTSRLTIEGVTISKADGTEVSRPIHSSNVIITKLDVSDSWRKEILTRTEEGAQ
ncbi:MAG TPA: 50S ribosomal protein L24 [Methanomassiliicoccales archaeon]|nr:50S ribosomal protein L24 [Methanomassiliicoccales archaeon]